jgi:Na+/H+ antiporter NhaD/arsenite permease-like protein
MSSQLSINASIDHSDHHAPKFTSLSWLAIALAVFITGFLIWHHYSADHGATTGHHEGPPAGYVIPHMWSIIPFCVLLLSIALLPLLKKTEHWWHSNLNRLGVAIGCAGLTILYYWFLHPSFVYNHASHETFTGAGAVIHVLEHAILGEYIPFIVLLFALYTISGGISLKGDLAAHPATNTAFIAVGGALASFIGTTGASMLLIRPLLQTNRERKHVRHTVIFFIFLVSNCGGLLLPIGDPPLFLGYLKGVPFLWTMHLWIEWLAVGIALLVIYFIWDTLAYRKETPTDVMRDETMVQPLRLKGKINLVYVIGVIFCVALVDHNKPFPGTNWHPFPFMRELLMLGFVALSLRTGPKQPRIDNKFDYHAILEVAALFVGIFICMQAPIEILNQKGPNLGLSQPWQFFWATGGLSSFLDNAPTYVVFFETAKTLPYGDAETLTLLGGDHIMSSLLIAISLGAVFMGAMTYIGNAPNFMVKSIAEQSGVKMPSFFGYMAYSCAVLVPLFLVVTLIFL